LLAYAVGLERTQLFVVESAARPGPGLFVHAIPRGEAALRLAVESFRRQIERGPAGDRSRLDREAGALEALLLGAAEPQLATATRILISPDGPLHLLPFAALQRAGVPLVSWKPVHVAPSATVYAEMKKTRDAAPRVWKLDLLAFGDPLYAPPLRRLPATRREVAAIATFFPGRSQVFVGGEATEERAKSLGKDARYVHFACHGLLNRRFPLDSAMALTPPRAPEAGLDNGLLQAWEVMEHMRLRADLVTLSACESGMGTEMGGEGLLGLTRAFLYAGARSVLASLWDVSDRGTEELMERFYRRLAKGEAKDEALRAAQVEMLRAKGPRSHPFYWAAFQLLGDRQ
jgi:CHAT domain-containing protein